MANITGVNSKYCCLKVQQSLNDILGADNPANKERDTMGFMKSLTSQRNTAGFEAIATRSREGKSLPDTGNREVEIMYRPKQCVSVSDSAASICNEGAASTDKNEYFRVSVDQVKSTSFTLGKAQFRDLCENPESRRGQEVADHVLALKKAVNDALLASVITGVGSYFSEDGATSADSITNPITLNLFNADVNPQPMGLYPLEYQYKRMQTARPIVVGGHTFSGWLYSNPVFRGNVDGLDGTTIQPFDTYIDWNLDTTWDDGNEHILSYVPGYMQILDWYQYDGIYAEAKENLTAQVLSIDGFTFDFSVYYDECDQEWHLNFTKYFDLWKVPDEAFSADCGQIHNGCLNWLVDCGDITCDIFTGAPAS